MIKLKNVALNKGLKAEENILKTLEEYDNVVVNPLDAKLINMTQELEHLKETGNIIESGKITEYLEKQKRLKVLPNQIQEIQQDKIKAIEHKKEVEDMEHIKLYEELRTELSEEFNSNMCILQKELFKGMEHIQKIIQEMEQQEEKYNSGLFNTINTPKVYLSFNNALYVNQVQNYFNMPKGALRLNNQYTKHEILNFNK